MPIEFPCQHCQSILRTADNTVGKQTKCPACGAIQDIPLRAATVPAPSSPFGGNPYASPVAQSSATMLVETSRGFTPSPIDVGDILNHTWAIYTKNLAQSIVGTLIVLAVSLAIVFPFIILMIPAMGLGAMMADQGNEPMGVLIFVSTIVLATLGLFAASIWLYAGMAAWFLKLARGEPNTFADLFHGGRYLGRVLGAGILVALATMAGYLLCIVPGVFITLIFSQFLWLIVDRDCGALESLGLSNQLAAGNKLNLFLVMLVVVAVSLAGQFIPLAFLFTMPFMWLLFAVTYLRITGQTTADMLTPPAPLMATYVREDASGTAG